MEKQINILLVEDDEIDVMNVKRAFKKNNISNPLHVCGNGVEALEYLKSIDNPLNLPRIILLDINMPRMGGIEFLRELRATDTIKHISVFVMTTSNEEQDKVNAYKLNVAGYILKPLSIESFISSVAMLNNYWMLCEYPD
ncbi:MAG: response regulator [Sphingobacteriales bacterium JAD_PAG50586_3]|nr:MAG: response regulator [Sphingobacteriales bacterium JAD_PAG50586_3]